MLTMLKLEHRRWKNLNFTQNWLLTFSRSEEEVQVYVEWPFSHTDLVLHPQNFEMFRFYNPLIRIKE